MQEGTKIQKQQNIKVVNHLDQSQLDQLANASLNTTNSQYLFDFKPQMQFQAREQQNLNLKRNEKMESKKGKNSKLMIKRNDTLFMVSTPNRKHSKMNLSDQKEDELKDMKVDQLRHILIDCMKEGKWLAFNFENEEGTKIMRFFDEEKFPLSILNPLEIYSESTIDKIVKHQQVFNKNDNFRLIFVTKSVLIPSQLKDNFELLIIDDDKIEEEDLVAKINRKQPENSSRIKMGQDLLEAAYNGDLDKLKQLVNGGSDIKFKDHDGNTCFLEASLMGHYEIVIYLLSLDEHKIDINYKNYVGRTALHKAAFGGHHQVCLILLESGADPKINDDALGQPIDYASNKRTIKLLKHWDIERTKSYWERNNKKNMKLFYEYLELDPQEREKVRLQVCEYAMKGNFTEIEKIILQGHASIETRNDNGNSLLSIACKYNQYKCAEQLLNIFNCSINTRDHKGWTPLIIASFHGFSKIVSLLIANKADPTVETNRQESALQIAQIPDIKFMIKSYQIGWSRDQVSKVIKDEVQNQNNELRESLRQSQEFGSILNQTNTKRNIDNKDINITLLGDQSFLNQTLLNESTFDNEKILRTLNDQTKNQNVSLLSLTSDQTNQKFPQIISKREQFFDARKLNESYLKRTALPTIDQRINGTLSLQDPQEMTLKIRQKMTQNANALSLFQPKGNIVNSQSVQNSPQSKKMLLQNTVSTNVSTNNSYQKQSGYDSDHDSDQSQPSHKKQNKKHQKNHSLFKLCRDKNLNNITNVNIKVKLSDSSNKNQSIIKQNTRSQSQNQHLTVLPVIVKAKR
eukprot:403333546